MRRQRKVYSDYKSKEKRFINKVLIARNLAHSAHVHKGLIYVLDSIYFRTTRALIVAGIDPKRICVVEKDLTVYKKMVQKVKKSSQIEDILVFYGDLFHVLYAHYCTKPILPLFPRLFSERSFPLRPGAKRPSFSLFAIVADLMQPRLSDHQLNTLAEVAEKTELQHCFITFTGRSPEGQTVEKRIEMMRKHRFGQILLDLSFVFGYRRRNVVRSKKDKSRKVGTVMIFLGFSRQIGDGTQYRPRKAVPLADGTFRVSWWGFPDWRSDTVEKYLPLYSKLARKQQVRAEKKRKARAQKVEDKENAASPTADTLFSPSTGKRSNEKESNDNDEIVAKRARRAVYRYPKSEPRET